MRRRAPRADRGEPRGAPVRRRAAALAARDRDPDRHRPGDRRCPAGRPGGGPPRARHPAAQRRRPGRAGDRPGGRGPGRPLRRRRRGPPVAGLAGDPGHRGLPPAGHEVGHRAHPRRRLRLHHPDPAPSAPGRGARPLRCAGPAVPVRDRLRVPGALRPDQPGGAAAARCRRRRPPGRGGRGADHRAPLPSRRARSRRPDAGRTTPEGPGRRRRRLPAWGRGAHRQRPGHRRWPAGQARQPGRPGHPDHRRRWQGHRRSRRLRAPASCTSPWA